MKRVWMGVVCVALVLVLPMIGNNYIIRLATVMMMYSVLALSWNFIGGFTGYPSFAGAAFFGLGAYAGAVSQVNGMPMFFAWIIGGLAAAIFAYNPSRGLLARRGGPGGGA